MKKENKTLAEALIPEDMRQKKIHAVMLFYRPFDLGVPGDIPGSMEWQNTRTYVFESITEAMTCYSDTPCPASQLVSAETKAELEKKMKEMTDNFKNEEWLNKNLYPYL